MDADARLSELQALLARRAPSPSAGDSRGSCDDLRMSVLLAVNRRADPARAAEIGTALVESQRELTAKLEAAERTREGLLERLAGSVRENAQLDKVRRPQRHALMPQHLERCTNNLEMVEASNRTLLATLEDDRRTIARLTAENARGAGIDAKLRALVGQRDDLRQELLPITLK